MGIIIKNDWDIPLPRWGSPADIQYAIKVNYEKVYGIDPESNVLTMPIFWGLPVLDYSEFAIRNTNQGAIYKDKYLFFDGNDYIDFHSHIPQDVRTISLTLNITSIANAPIIYTGLDTFDSNSWYWGAYYLNGNFYMRGSPGGLGATVAYSINEKPKLVMVRNDGGNFKVYKNGINIISDATYVGAPSPGENTDGYLRVAKAGINYLNSALSEIRLSNITYTASQTAKFAELPYGLYQPVPRPFYLFLFGGTSLSATLPAITAELMGGGRLDATLPAITSELIGSGRLDATLPMITASIEGRYGLDSLEATLPAITAEFEGASGGFLETTLPAITADIKGGAILKATLPAITASLEGDVQIAGDLIVSLPAITASLEGKVNVHGDLVCVLPAITAELIGTMEVGGNLACTLPMITAELNGFQDITGELVATLPAITAYLFGATDRFADCDVLRYEEPEL